MKLPSPVWVSTEEGLEDCVSQCSGADAIAVDTEFMRTDTFYPILGLIQVSDGTSVWLIDPLSIDDFAALERLFHDPAVTKVFHSCSEDLEVLRHQLGLIPSPLFDTQVAAAFLGYGFSKGYSALMDAVLDIQLAKHETRSDWLQRPLSASQQEYAAEDVFFLIKAYYRINAQLIEMNRESWALEEMSAIVTAARQPENLEDYYLRIKGAWKLSGEELARLQELAQWREQEARERNRPRNRVITDALLMDIARYRPQTVEDLKQIRGIHPGFIKRYGSHIVALVSQSPGNLDVKSLPGPLEKADRKRLASARECVEQIAAKNDMSPELLARKKDLEAFVRSGELSEALSSGWRAAVIGEGLNDV